MGRYCKAYQLAELRRFPAWTESGEARLDDDAIVYIWDDLTVVTNPVRDGTLWDTVSADWERFCREELKFEIPEELAND
jgi:hypothetical protein